MSAPSRLARITYFYRMERNGWLRRNHKPVFYAAWLLVNLVQAGATGLFDDEAYYWIYSRYPDWGYFDHPPAIALMIRAGYNLFANEFGVRLFVVLISTATLFAIDSLLAKRDDKLFYAIALSMGLLQIGGIIAVPDLPLLFFVALFFLAYRSFVQQPGWMNTIVLGAITALMFYSKYHGILVVGFTILSDWKLLLRWRTWAAGLVAMALFMPHVYWQYAHDYPSVRYHLFERNASDYQVEFTVQYIIGQVLLAGPLVGWLMLWAAARHKPADHLERAMRWTYIGIYLLFLAGTFKGRSEANWTVPAWVAMIVLAHQYLAAHAAAAKWIYRLWIPSFLIVLALRVYMAVDIAPLSFMKKDEFHKNREWAEAIRSKAGGRPVAFINSYQRASQYWFYTGDTAFSLNNVYYRRNNFNFWPLEARLQGRDVLVSSPDNYAFFSDTVWNSRKLTGSATVSPYFSFSQVALRGEGDIEGIGGRVRAVLDVTVPADLRSSPAYEVHDTASVYLTVYFHDNDPGIIIPTGSRLRDTDQGRLVLDFNLPDTLQPGRYRARWAIHSAIPGWPSVNSSAATLVVADR
jgi:hypothetical protein